MNLPSPFIPFDDLTIDQRHDLDTEAVDWYIDRACADAGVKLLPPDRPIQPVIAVVPKSVVHYVVTGLRFSDAAAAHDVAKFINRYAQWRRDVHYVGPGFRWAGPTYDCPADSPEVSVTQESVHTLEEAEMQESINARTSDAKTAYEAAKKEYDHIAERRGAIATRIYGTISAAHTTVHRRERIQADFDRYVRLANGDRHVAARFLYAAYGADAALTGIERPDDAVATIAPGDIVTVRPVDILEPGEERF